MEEEEAAAQEEDGGVPDNAIVATSMVDAEPKMSIDDLAKMIA